MKTPILHYGIDLLVALCVLLWLSACGSVPPQVAQDALRGTGNLGLVIARADGRVQIVDNSTRQSQATVPGLGDLSHASGVFSRAGRYA